MSNAVNQSLTEKEQREIRMYGCTVAEMRESVEDSLTFRFSGPAMVAAGMMSDCQEMLAHQAGPTYAAQAAEDCRKTLNRAKWVLSTYCMKETV